jgi:hypothetical protein
MSITIFESVSGVMSVPLDRQDAAVHEELDTGDEAALLRGEKQNRLGDLLRLSDSTKRRHLLQEILHLRSVLKKSVNRRRIDDPR